MSDFTMNDGSCFLFKNKADGNKPHMKGKAKIDGVEYEIALWPSKSGKEGSFSGKISIPKPKTQNQEVGSIRDAGDPPPRGHDLDDEIPF